MKTEGYWWGFTRDGKLFVNLKIDNDDPDAYELLEAYAKHPKRFSRDVPVTFVLWDKTKQKVRSVTAAELEDHEAMIRSFHEEAAQNSLPSATQS